MMELESVPKTGPWAKLGFPVFLVVSTLALLAIVEGVSRVAFPYARRQATEAALLRPNGVGDAVGWVPNAKGISFDEVVEVDARGFLEIGGPERYDEAWLLLGDSVTVGVGVAAEETFAGLLQASHPTVRLFNTAVIGYAIDDYVTVFRELTSGPEPVRRALVFFCLNDFAGRMTLARDDSPLTRLRFWLRDGSTFYQWLKGRTTDRSGAYFEAVAPSYAEGTPGWERVSAGIAALRRIAEERQVDLRVVVLPYEAQLRAGAPQSLHPQEMLRARLAAEGVPALDLTPVFARQEGPMDDLFLWKDAMHLSPAGHALVAREVGAWLAAAPAETPSP